MAALEIKKKKETKKKKNEENEEEEEAISILVCGEDVIFLQLLSKAVEKEWPCTRPSPPSKIGRAHV